MNDRLLTASVPWLILRQGLPMAVGMASHALFNLVDLWMVGEFGAEAVAGTHVATTVSFAPMVFGNAFSVAAMALMSQALGRDDRDLARRISNWSQWVMLLGGLLLGFALAACAVPLVDAQQVTGTARGIGVDYLVVSSLGTFTMFALMQTTASMRALGEAAMPFALLVGANVLNIALNFPLMFGWERFGIPSLGPVGAAWASWVSRAVACGVAYLWLRRGSCGLRLGPASLRPPIGVTRRVLELSGPQAVQMLARLSPVFAVTALAGELGGNSAITALGVTTRLDSMVLFSALGFASAATAVAGHNVGADRPARARAAARHAGLQALVFGVVVIAGLVALGPWLMRQFVDEPGPAVLTAAISYLHIAAWGHPLAALQIAITGAVNGAGRTVPPMLLDVGAFLLVFLPAGIALVTAWPEAGLVGLWWVVVGTQIVLLVAYLLYMERGSWLSGAGGRGVPDSVTESTEPSTGALPH